MSPQSISRPSLCETIGLRATSRSLSFDQCKRREIQGARLTGDKAQSGAVNRDEAVSELMPGGRKQKGMMFTFKNPEGPEGRVNGDREKNGKVLALQFSEGTLRRPFGPWQAPIAPGTGPITPLLAQY